MNTVSIRVSKDMHDLLGELSEKTYQTRQYHANCAIYEYIMRKHEELEKINKLKEEMK